MLILGIESSCDETAAAVVRDGVEILSSVIASQIDMHRPWGGVVPELASREHLENIDPIVNEALTRAGVALSDIDAIAVTQGPGLIGSLLVGVCYAKALAFSLGIPFVGAIFASVLSPIAACISVLNDEKNSSACGRMSYNIIIATRRECKS